jgi:hypothetical protein
VKETTSPIVVQDTVIADAAVKEPIAISPPVTESVLPIAPVEPILTVVPQDQTPVEKAVV